MTRRAACARLSAGARYILCGKSKLILILYVFYSLSFSVFNICTISFICFDIVISLCSIFLCLTFNISALLSQNEQLSSYAFLILFFIDNFVLYTQCPIHVCRKKSPDLT